jgi:hypothetical protein
VARSILTALVIAGRRPSAAMLRAGLAILALLLQLTPPVLSPLDVAQAPNPLAAFGPHAICLANAGHQEPAPTQQHREHQACDDSQACCMWHMGAALIVPSSPVAIRIAYAVRVAAASPVYRRVPSAVGNTPQARAPPSVI